MYGYRVHTRCSLRSFIKQRSTISNACMSLYYNILTWVTGRQGRICAVHGLEDLRIVVQGYRVSFGYIVMYREKGMVQFQTSIQKAQ